MEKRIFVHVGFPKAGSTYLQKAIFPNLPLEKVDFNPVEIIKPLTEIMRLAYVHNKRDINEVTGLKTKIRNSLALLDDKKLLFISNEGLIGIHYGDLQFFPYFVQLIKELFGDYVNIILIVRDEIEWLRSNYNHSIKWGYITPINKYINYKKGRFDKKNTKDWSVDVNALSIPVIFEMLHGVFKKQIYILKYEELFTSPQTILRTFEQIFQCEIKSEQLTFEKVNFSKPISELKLKGNISKYVLYNQLWKDKFTYLTNYYSFSNAEKLRFRFFKLSRLILEIACRIFLNLNYNSNTRFFTSKQQKQLSEIFEANAQFIEENKYQIPFHEKAH